MKIWIVNQYASLPTDGIGGRHRHLARELAALGHDVTVVAARQSHLTRDPAIAQAAGEVERYEGFRFVRVRVPPSRNARGWRRVLSWAIFAWGLPGLPRRLREKPDLVLYSSPSLLGFAGAERLARKCGARLVFEVRDIWPLTLTEVGAYSPNHPFIRLLQGIEDRAYRVSDQVVSNLRGAVDHMATRGMDRTKFAWIPNGISIREASEPCIDRIKSFQRETQGRFVVGYAGTLGAANALETLLEAAARLRDEADILFAVVGAGPEEDALKALAARLNLSNIVFLPPVAKAQIPNLIETFDVGAICWRRLKLYEYGTAANKMFDYFHAGKPVVQAYSGGYDLVTAYDAGVTVAAEDAGALADAIIKLRALPAAERARLGANGRREAGRHHEYAGIAKRLERVLVGQETDARP